MGGGFGGKETRSIFVSCAAAVAAKKLKRPIRLALDRDDVRPLSALMLAVLLKQDMLLTGGRHPFLGKYKVGFNKDGTIQALDIKLYSNAGWSPLCCNTVADVLCRSMDLSRPVMERALFHIDN